MTKGWTQLSIHAHTHTHTLTFTEYKREVEAKCSDEQYKLVPFEYKVTSRNAKVLKWPHKYTIEAVKIFISILLNLNLHNLHFLGNDTT